MNSHLLILPFPLTMKRFAALLFVFRQLFSRSTPPIKERGDSVLKHIALLVQPLRLPHEGPLAKIDPSGGRALRSMAPNMMLFVVVYGGGVWGRRASYTAQTGAM